MNDNIRREVDLRGIRRLCHFTPTRNLVHILTDEAGVDARQRLDREVTRPFTPTDPTRLDGYPDHISCSVEYPNVWYLETVMQRDPVFRDWVLLFVAPHHLWAPETRFCPHNAALHAGRDVAAGQAAFRALFAPSVTGSGGVTRARSATHLGCSPTDDQAEVLIHGPVPLSDISGICVTTEAAAEEHWARLKLLGLGEPAIPFIIAPELFDKYRLRARIVAGQRPGERAWVRTT